MTRPRALLAGVALVGTILLVLSCGKAPTAPSVSAVRTAIPGSQLSTASQTWTRFSIAEDRLPVYCECLGEKVHFSGERVFEYHFVTTGSGSFQVQWHGLAITPPTGAPLTAYGETSGKVFVILASPNTTTTFNLGPNIQVQTWVDRETYAAADGSRIVATTRLHVTGQADGHVIVEKAEPWSIDCLK